MTAHGSAQTNLARNMPEKKQHMWLSLWKERRPTALAMQGILARVNELQPLVCGLY